MGRKKNAAQAAADDTAEEMTEPTTTEIQLAEQNPATPIVRQIAEGTAMPDDGTDFDPERLEQESPRQERFAQREQKRRADPFPVHTIAWPDGYQIRYQESDSRRTAEIQFGDGTRAGQPENFEAIKPVLRDAGMRWNQGAWYIDLAPTERGSLAQQENARRENRDIRSRIEDVLTTVVALEEEKRGAIELTDETRQRINKAAGHTR